MYYFIKSWRTLINVFDPMHLPLSQIHPTSLPLQTHVLHIGPMYEVANIYKNLMDGELLFKLFLHVR